MKKQQIIITGAPSSGKSSTLIQLARVLSDEVIIIPESAVVLLAGGFPSPSHEDIEQIRAFQKAIIQVQIGLELIFSKQNPDANWMVLDRGIIDGAGFWPEGPDAFFEEFNLNQDKALARYDFVLFFELPKKEAFGGINHVRFHNYEQSLESEKNLKKVWGKHPHFIEIRATEIFEDKIASAIAVIKKIINNQFSSFP